MKRRTSILSTATAAAAAAGLILSVSSFNPGWGEGHIANPHAILENPDECTSCHKEVPERGKDDYSTVTFVDAIVMLCSKCHEDAHYRDEHPVEIRPEFKVPTEFHLDAYYTMTCATCHDPHGQHVADRPFLPSSFVEKIRRLIDRPRQFPTYFLRQSNAAGELCLSCHTTGIAMEGESGFSVEILSEYVGSVVCRECHPDYYDEWRKTLHARNFRDAVEDKDAVRGKFEDGEPFPKEKVLFTVGEHWTQRYIVEGRKGLSVKPESWALIEEKWTKSGSFGRPWLRYCAGCHVTALNPYDGKYSERGTGCESCHGPGLKHVESTDQFDIINPDLLTLPRKNMICESCHTSGHDRSGVYRYPVGYLPGEDLQRYYRGLVPKSGQGTESFTGDGSYEDRHRQFEYWSSRLNILEGLSCDICTTHSLPPPDTEQLELLLSRDEMCGMCHRDIVRTAGEHAAHSRDQAGCFDCHPPMLNPTEDEYSVHDHKFQFGAPDEWMAETKDLCDRCHPGEGYERASLLPQM